MTTFFHVAMATNAYFHPVASINAKTQKKGKIVYEKSALGNLNTFFFANTLFYSLHDRFSAGSAPVWYLQNEHEYNYALKYNFYRSANFDWALSFVESAYKFKMDYP